MIRYTRLIPATLLIAASAHGQVKCDRACLESFVDKYLDAMMAHDPKLVAFARNAKFTENGQRLELGDGLWNTFAGKGTYRLFVTDTDAGQVAFMGTFREDGRDPKAPIPAVMALRLKVVKGQVTEAETLVARNDGGTRAANNLEKMGKPHPLFTQQIPETERLSRAELVKTANMYFSGMEKNDGRGNYPFTDDCNRIEMGSPTTNAPLPAGQVRPDPATSTNYSASWSCMEQFKSGLLHFVYRIRDRRFVAVDRERGLVFCFGFFDHPGGKTRNFETPDGRKVTAGPAQPWTWEMAEMFRIEKGKLRQIEAIMDRSPYGMLSGWSSWEEGMSSAGRDVTGVH
jgi:hypothetical protein